MSKGDSPIDIWHNKIKHLRRLLRGWDKNLSGIYEKEKERLCLIIDELDIKAKSTPLSASKVNALKRDNDRLSQLR
jgi:hypothetical protein